MINLLPPELKTGYRYATRNVMLRRWVIIFVIALLGLGSIGTFGLLTLRQTSRHYQKQIDSTETAFEKENYEATQKHVQDISNSFKLVVKVLSQEVLFSQLIKQIGTTIPANASLTSLNINQASSAMDITASASDYKTATQVQVNLADPKNRIFSKADLVSINCDSKQSSGTSTAQYPCTVNIRALFAQDNPFLFINSKGPKR